MRVLTFAALAAITSIATPALAQDADGAFNGPYVGGSFGYGFQRNNDGDIQRFDRGFDGSFDTITTTTGGNAFSPGFCGGAAQGATPADGCENDQDDIEYHVRAGFDAQFGDFVAGLVGEFGKSEISDSVTSFSTTPASYTMTREIDWEANLRGRGGYLVDEFTLAYATAGAAYAKIDNSFATTNTVNAFADNGSSDSWGFVVGTGIERSIGRNFSVGLEYLYTRYTDDDYRVRALAGNAVASNPFVLNGQPGTEFSRNDDEFDRHSLRVTAALRF